MRWRIFSLVFGLLPTAALGQAYNCANWETPGFSMGPQVYAYCAQRDYQAADARLNDLWADLLPLLGPETEEDVRAAQRAWIAHRDAHCQTIVGLIWAGGTGRFAAEMVCKRDETMERILELEALQAYLTTNPS